MTDSPFARTELIFGKEALDKLARFRVAVFGIGGVGGYAVEALARSGIGALDLIDNDTVAVSNLNRQIVATTKTIGQYKVDVAAKRVSEINPECAVRTYKSFFLPETAGEFDFSQYDYVVDAIDTVSGKIGLVLAAQTAGVPVISAMGAGNKIDPTAFEVADIYKTSVCPLAHVMRKELKKRGVKSLKVVYSKENPVTPATSADSRKRVPGSTAFVPPVVGLIIAGEVVKDLIRVHSKQ
ncbi:MAG: tRNA threonylcarbamoyladenosine dehydratase [Alphaproteobacteria bacterium]|nr:tRNA threonylcarbamoyladenosine dehydratase [Alphaproteobacteria bacterium]